MKQPGALVVLVIFVAAVSFVVASEQYKNSQTITVTLSGLNEVPGFGDPDGTGILKYQLDQIEGKICYEMSIANIKSATSVTIGSGVRSKVGSVIATLETPTNDVSNGCVRLDQARLADLTKYPGRYYVNVANSEFPNGAIRAQLGFDER